MNYLEFFELKEDPFRLTPDPLYFYPSDSHNNAISSLNYILEQKEGFFMCTGEPGTGKTTMLNIFLNSERWKNRTGIALVLTPRLSPEEFLLTILEDLNVKVESTNKNEIIKAFRDFLVDNAMLDRRVIIIIDEAQNLPDETLEELRLLSNLETEKEKLLQIVLIGQPELRRRLLLDSLKQLNQRIAVRAELRPLNQGETSDYINYRLVKAGKGNVIFEERTKRFIHKLSRGIPRLINLISSRAIMAAYLDMSRSIKKRHVNYAARHVSDSLISTTRRFIKFPRAAVYMLFFCIVIAAILLNKGIIGNVPQVSNIEYKKPTRIAVVAVDFANIRAKPTVKSEIIERASHDTSFEITDEFAEISGRKWYKVRLSTEREGWVAGKIVKLVNSE